MPHKPEDIEKQLVNKFLFVASKERSVDHRWYEIRLPGLPIIATKVSHSKKDIGPKLESKIARQVRVRHPYFKEMMDCTKSCKEYYAQVRKDPYPPFDIKF